MPTNKKVGQETSVSLDIYLSWMSACLCIAVQGRSGICPTVSPHDWEAKLERGDANRAAREDFLRQAAEHFQNTLALDSENLTAHYNLALIYEQLGDTQRAATHRQLHERYRPDDNARDRTISIHRRQNPAADHAAQAIVIYDLQRAGAPELPSAKSAISATQKTAAAEPDLSKN